MNKQEIFDKVVTHLRQQGIQAIGLHSRCQYRTLSGLKCAVGCLIPDKKYRKDIEDNAIDYVIKTLDLPELEPHIVFLTKLQSIHDSYGIQYWEEQFKSVAAEWNLTYTPPECK